MNQTEMDVSEPRPLDAELASRVRMVLVEPTHPGNIGAAARAMMNMGLSELWLVNPLRFPDPEARFRATNAVDLVERARVVPTLEEAIDDCTFVVGASARTRRVPWPLVEPREVGPRLIEEARGGAVAVLFGREASGLTNDELARCQLHLHIPSDPAYPSLNVAMALQIVAYEVRMAWLDAGARPAEPEWDRPWATSAAVEGMLGHLEQVARRVGFLDTREFSQVLLRLRRLFFRTRLDEVEVNIMRGICSAVERSLPVQDAQSDPRD